MHPRIALCFVPFTALGARESISHRLLELRSCHCSGTMVFIHGERYMWANLCRTAQCSTLGWRSGIPSCAITPSRASGSTSPGTRCVKYHLRGYCRGAGRIGRQGGEAPLTLLRKVRAIVATRDSVQIRGGRIYPRAQVSAEVTAVIDRRTCFASAR